MRRQLRVLPAAALAGMASLALPVPSPAQPPARTPRLEATTVRAARAALTGFVSDEAGSPVRGAMVTALGATMALVTSDERGRFSFLDLPYGEYIVRAQLAGFAASRREIVQVGQATRSIPRLELRRLNGTVATTGPVDPALKGRTILAAGFESPAEEGAEYREPATATPPAKVDHPHNETAWRLRHAKRSILKDSAREVVVSADDELADGSVFGRAFGSAGNLAASFFTDYPISGEVNVLTTSAFAPGEFTAHAALPRGVAYLSIGAPTPAGDWLVRAAMSQGDLASWVVAGSFVSKRRASHAYTVGMSYSIQEYQGGNPAALAAVTETGRNVGQIYAYDSWRVSPAVSVDFGGDYSHFDYLERRALLSPRAGVTIEPVKGTRVLAAVAQRMVAPGAEEFISSGLGPWLPPERTFAPLAGDLRPERTRYVNVGFEQDLGQAAFVIGVRRFYQSVDDQLATLFGMSLPGGPQSVGHYYVSNVGALDADGWTLRFASPAAHRVQAAIDYSITQARWSARANDLGLLASWAPAAIRPDQEDIHDITTSVHTEIPETATRVFVLYRFSNGYTRFARPDRPGLDGRFDVQVNQALPIAVAGTKWEVLLGMRNLFRDPTEPGSVYDELLVVRPPKRVVGGFLVRF